MAIYAPPRSFVPRQASSPPSGPFPYRTVRAGGGAALAASVAVLVIAVAAMVYAAAGLGRQQAAAHHTVVTVPAPGPVYSSGEILAAKSKACAAWDTGGRAIGAASRDVAATPKDWDDPATKRALAAQSRTLLTESGNIRASMAGATPPDVRALINDYIDRGFAIQDAELHHQGSKVSALITSQNASGLVNRIEAACGIK